MYLVGEEHPRKRDTISILEELSSEKRKLVTSVEIFQELLHRYTAIQRQKDIQIVFDALYGLVEEVFSISRDDVFNAKDLILRYPQLSARDALHVAVMNRHKIDTILSFDRGFDSLVNIKRIPETSKE